MRINKFEEIEVWKKSRRFIKKLYLSLSNCKDFSFRDQICRAAVSIMNNIAEGFEKPSDIDFRRFLFISKASAAEVRSMLYLAYDLNYISKEKLVELYKDNVEISKMLSGFIKKLS